MEEINASVIWKGMMRAGEMDKRLSKAVQTESDLDKAMANTVALPAVQDELRSLKSAVSLLSSNVHNGRELTKLIKGLTNLLLVQELKTGGELVSKLMPCLAFVLRAPDTLRDILSFIGKKILVEDPSMITTYFDMSTGSELTLSFAGVMSMAALGEDGNKSLQKALITAQEQLSGDICEKVRAAHGSNVLRNFFREQDFVMLQRQGATKYEMWLQPEFLLHPNSKFSNRVVFVAEAFVLCKFISALCLVPAFSTVPNLGCPVVVWQRVAPTSMPRLRQLPTLGKQPSICKNLWPAVS